MTRDEIINTLRQNIVELSFTKVKDGEVRNMTATLEQGYIPEEKMPKSGSVDQSVGGESSVRGFAIVVNAWRSFRVDSLLTFSAI